MIQLGEMTLFTVLPLAKQTTLSAKQTMAQFTRLIIRLFSLFFFQSEQCFSLTTNQPTVFSSRFISTAERDQRFAGHHNTRAYRNHIFEGKNIVLLLNWGS
jgi:hypothetical protein